jgi:hypothetical protein
VRPTAEAGLTASASEAADMARNKETLVVLLDASVIMRPHLHVALQSVASLLHRKAELLSPPSPSSSKSVVYPL